ncbi:MAG: hypothetical protein ABJB49_06900 [Nitrospirota bacterium]
MRPLRLSSIAVLAGLGVIGFLAAILSSTGTAQSAGAEYMPVCNHPRCINPQVTSKSGIGTANATVEAKVLPEGADKWCAANNPRYKYCSKDQVEGGGTGAKRLYRASADCVAGRMTAIDGNTYTYAGVWPDGAGKGRPRFNTSNPRFPSKKWDETGVEMDGGGSITGWGGGSPNLAAQWEVLCAGAPAPAVK